MVQGCLIASIGYASAGVAIILRVCLKIIAGKHHAAQPACPLSFHWLDRTWEWVGVHPPCSDYH